MATASSRSLHGPAAALPSSLPRSSSAWIAASIAGSIAASIVSPRAASLAVPIAASTTALLAMLFVASPAAAVEPAAPAAPSEPAAVAPAADDWQTAPATRRSGFTLGVTAGMGITSVVGFPNDVKKIGYQPYYTATGIRPAPVVSLWLGGALTDWLNFGVGFTMNNIFTAGDTKAQSAAGGFHVEAFPLFYVRESLRDLGIFLDLGAGAASVTSAKDAKLVDSSAASLVGGGLMWEPVQFWRFRGGPFVMGNYMWSDTARRPGFFAGWRMNLYSGSARRPSATAARSRWGTQ